MSDKTIADKDAIEPDVMKNGCIASGRAYKWFG